MNYLIEYTAIILTIASSVTGVYYGILLRKKASKNSKKIVNSFYYSGEFFAITHYVVKKRNQNIKTSKMVFSEMDTYQQNTVCY